MVKTGTLSTFKIFCFVVVFFVVENLHAVSTWIGAVRDHTGVYKAEYGVTNTHRGPQGG